jgi:hypothetical protein
MGGQGQSDSLNLSSPQNAPLAPPSIGLSGAGQRRTRDRSIFVSKRSALALQSGHLGTCRQGIPDPYRWWEAARSTRWVQQFGRRDFSSLEKGVTLQGNPSARTKPFMLGIQRNRQLNITNPYPLQSPALPNVRITPSSWFVSYGLTRLHKCSQAWRNQFPFF